MSKDKDTQSELPDNPPEAYSEDKRRRTQALQRMIQSLKSLDDERENQDTSIPDVSLSDAVSAGDVANDVADDTSVVNTNSSADPISDVSDKDDKLDVHNIKSDVTKKTSSADELTSDANIDHSIVQDKSVEPANIAPHDAVTSERSASEADIDTADDDTTDVSQLADAWDMPAMNDDDDSFKKKSILSSHEMGAVQDEHNPHALDGLMSSAPVATSLQDSQSMLPIDTQSRIIESQPIVRNDALASANVPAPWTLQQFFNGEIDLDVELTRRFPSMPMMSLIKFRTLGARHGRNVATLRSQDGSATVIIDADRKTKTIWLSFTIGSMLTLRFSLDELSTMDRSRWLDLMGRDEGGLAFLWGAARWAQDYMICISRKYHTNLYAFSPNNFEAAVRLTPGVTSQLLDWLEDIWAEDAPDDEPPQMLTW